VGDALARLEGGDDGVHMGVEQRARIDDSDLAVADDVGAGAEVGELAGVLGHDPTDERRDLIDAAIGDIEVADEGDRHGHRSGPVAGEGHRLGP